VWSRHGTNFVTTMIRLAAERPTVSVVDDQVGAPTLSADLAAGLVALGERAEPAPPLLHLTGAGGVSWYGFARAVFTAIGADPDRVLPTTTDAFPRPAPRPAYSVLDLSAWTAAGLPAPRPWADALREELASAG
jgi:dTDP-4-dehydrorhamnose reductase